METKIQSRSSFQNGTIDVVKFLCALLIVTAHFITENAENKVPSFVNYFVSLYVIVVPFFFVCGGYFLFRKIFSEREKGKVYIKNYLKKILIMYLAWSAVYVLFKIAAWIRFGVTFDEITQYLFRAVLYSTYKTIWFLPALGIGVLITYLLEKKFGMKITLIVAGCFYLIGALGVSYSFILKGTPAASVLDTYNYFFESTRNGVFNAFPFVTLGALLAAGKIKTDVTEKKELCCSGSDFYITVRCSVCGESIFDKNKVFSCQRQHAVIFSTVFLLLCEALSEYSDALKQGHSLDAQNEYCYFFVSAGISDCPACSAAGKHICFRFIRELLYWSDGGSDFGTGSVCAALVIIEEN